MKESKPKRISDSYFNYLHKKKKHRLGYIKKQNTFLDGHLSKYLLRGT